MPSTQIAAEDRLTKPPQESTPDAAIVHGVSDSSPPSDSAKPGKPAPARPPQAPVAPAAAATGPVSIAPWEDIPPEHQKGAGQSVAHVPAALPPERMPVEQPAEAALVLPVVELPASRRERPLGASAASTPSAERRLVPTELGEAWHALAESLIDRGLLTGIARELLLQSQLLHQAAQETGAAQALWTLRVESETLNHEGSRRRLEGALAELGHAVLLRIECGRVVDTPGMRLAKARAAEQERAEQTFIGHPYVQAMMRDLGAQPVAGSIRFTREPGAQGA